MSKAPTVFSNYHPSYWLAALGAGGLSVSFFMYLMWMIPHHGYPMPTWEHLKHAWETTTASGMPMVPIILPDYMYLASASSVGKAHGIFLINKNA